MTPLEDPVSGQASPVRRQSRANALGGLYVQPTHYRRDYHEKTVESRF